MDADELLPSYDFSTGMRGKHHNGSSPTETQRRAVKILLREVCRLLWQEWDPIRVNAASTASDEYDSYAGTLCRMLLEGRDEHALMAYLQDVQIISMGLSAADVKRDRRVARLLLELVNSGGEEHDKNL